MFEGSKWWLSGSVMMSSRRWKFKHINVTKFVQSRPTSLYNFSISTITYYTERSCALCPLTWGWITYVFELSCRVHTRETNGAGFDSHKVIGFFPSYFFVLSTIRSLTCNILNNMVQKYLSYHFWYWWTGDFKPMFLLGRWKKPQSFLSAKSSYQYGSQTWKRLNCALS